MIKNTDKLIMLMDEIAVAKSRLQPHDTGHIHTSISWLQHRVEEVKKELETDYVDVNDKRVRLNRNLWDAAYEDGTIKGV
tara:strand:- start:274 stop:513 length:240 start_codon:yes stop_codon:yes gene_type:complete